MKKLFIFNFIENIILVALIALPLRLFVFEPFFILGSSMEPNFHPFDYIIIDKLTFNFRQPHRGEVIVFRPSFDTKVYYIKRIVGLPGELVEIKDGAVYVNGQKLKEDYFSNEKYTPGNTRAILGKGEYFVLGDNREQSFDSRSWGPVKAENIVGKIFFRISLTAPIFKKVRYY